MNGTLPKGISVENRGTESVIRYRWFRPAFLFVLFVVIPFNAISIFVATLMIPENIKNFDKQPFFIIILPFLFLVFGAAFLYLALALTINSSFLVVSSSMFTAHNAPLPLPFYGIKKFSIPRSQVKDILILQKEQMNKGAVSIFYNLQIQMNTDTQLDIVKFIPDQKKAEDLRDLLRNNLGITG